MDEIKERLKLLRKKYGYTQEYVGSYLGISENAYGHYEAGRRNPTLDSIIKLSQLYGCTTDYLLLGDINPQARKQIIHYDERGDVSSIDVIHKNTPKSLYNDPEFRNAVAVVLEDVLHKRNDHNQD